MSKTVSQVGIVISLTSSSVCLDPFSLKKQVPPEFVVRRCCERTKTVFPVVAVVGGATTINPRVKNYDSETFRTRHVKHRTIRFIHSDVRWATVEWPLDIPSGMIIVLCSGAADFFAFFAIFAYSSVWMNGWSLKLEA